MNSYQRVMNTLSGQPVDRLPVFAVLGGYGGKLTETPLQTLLSDADAYVQGQKALQQRFGFDLVMSAFDFSVLGEAFGAEIAWSSDQIPNIRRPAVRRAVDALSLPVPDINTTCRLPVVVEINRQLCELYKEQVPIISVLPGPCIFPSLLIGIEQWMETILFDQQLAQELLDFTAPFFIDWANSLLAAGADCLAFTEGMASQEIIPRDIFSEQFHSHLHTVFREINGPKIVSSTGGRMNHVVDLLVDLDGIVGIISGSKDDLNESRELLGPGLALVGNLDNLTLPAVSKEEVYRICMETFRTAAPNGPFIIANAGADIPQATPPENLDAIISAGKNYSTETGCGT